MRDALLQCAGLAAIVVAINPWGARGNQGIRSRYDRAAAAAKSHKTMLADRDGRLGLRRAVAGRRAFDGIGTRAALDCCDHGRNVRFRGGWQCLDIQRSALWLDGAECGDRHGDSRLLTPSAACIDLPWRPSILHTSERPESGCFAGAKTSQVRHLTNCSSLGDGTPRRRASQTHESAYGFIIPLR